MDGKIFLSPHKSMYGRVLCGVKDVMYVTCTVLWRLFIKVKAECTERPRGQVMCGCDAT